MNCPTCQAALPEHAAFCGHCGGALRSERTCARCGRSNSAEMRFCLGCGAALSPAAPAQAPRTYTPKHLAYFQLRDRGETRIKGLNDLLHVFELEGVGRMRTRLEVSHARGFSKFVGRQSEMAALEAALERAISGNAQVVGVVAEPGTGKSRLCYEFVERCRARGIRFFEGHAVAHGKTIPLLPFMELLRNARHSSRRSRGTRRSSA
jgi:AAA ATPase domain/Double zinc ribbon